MQEPTPETDSEAPESNSGTYLPIPLQIGLFLLVFGGTFWGLKEMGYLPQGGERPPADVRELIPAYGEVPAFSLLEASGQGLTREKLKGKIWIVSFIFTSCAGTCPIMATRNQALQGALPEDVLLLSISVDPDTDTPEVLNEWGKRFDRDPKKWLLATGDFLHVHKLMRKGLKLLSDDPIAHSTGFVLVDNYGIMRGYYESMQEDEMNRLLKDVKKLKAEMDLFKDVSKPEM